MSDRDAVVIEIPQAAYDAGKEALINDSELADYCPVSHCAGAVTGLVLRAAFPVVLAAAYTELADQLTELAEHIRNVGRQTDYPKTASLRAAGLVEGITVIRKHAARLTGQ